MLRLIILLLGLLLPLPVSAQKVVPETKAQIQFSYAPIVKTSAPAVVNIYTKKIVKTRTSGMGLFFNDSFLNQFFGDLPDTGFIRNHIERSLGSGVIVRANGVVVTNNHVIDGADEIIIALNDKREFAAKVLGTDKKTDLAILQIDNKGEDLPYLEIGNSDALEVGDLVLAIGNPFGVGQTVTSGIVSAKARAAGGRGDFRSYIQTDAAINPGNSGGALVAMDGTLIGVPTIILSKSGQNSGVGMATPSNLVAITLDSILKTGKVIRPWLGIAGQSISGDIASTLGLDRAAGVLISRLHKVSPAAKAGLMVGDIITKIGGEPIDDLENMYYRLVTMPVGGTISIEVLRRKDTLSFDVALIPPPEEPARDVKDLSGIFRGITVTNINPAVIYEKSLDFDEEGVLVINEPQTRLGLRDGDIVDTINGYKIKEVKDLAKISQKKLDILTLKIKRGNKVFEIMVRP